MIPFLNYIVWDPSPIAFRLGSFAVHYYAFCWMIGLGLGLALMQKIYKQQGFKVEQAQSLFFYIFIGVLIGGRLGHCLFYQPDYYLSAWDHVVEMLLPIRHLPEGGWRLTGYEGLASHGGVIGMLVGIWLYCRNEKMSGWMVLDNMGICSGITATFIRLGNLMNSEIIGKVTDVPWAFIFAKVDGYPRHPGQLYESLAYFCFFLLILLVYRKLGPKSVGKGLYFGLCLTLIFTFRFLIEYTKEIQEAFEASLPIDMGQILSLPLIAIGVWSLVRGWRLVRK